MAHGWAPSLHANSQISRLRLGRRSDPKPASSTMTRWPNKVGKWMSQEALPLVNREGGTMHHIVINVDVLDGDVRERDAEAERAGPPVVREASQGCTVADHHHHLRAENGGKYIPPSSWLVSYFHVNGYSLLGSSTHTKRKMLPNYDKAHIDHLLLQQRFWARAQQLFVRYCSIPFMNTEPTHRMITRSSPVRRDLGEEECQILWHWVWLVRGREEPIGLQAPVLIVLLNGEHLVAALGNAGRVGVTLAWKSILQRCNFVVVFVLLLQLLKIFFFVVKMGGGRLTNSTVTKP